MGAITGISWTHHTMNPWIGCSPTSKGCERCYARVLAEGRMGRPGLWGPQADRHITTPAYWRQPLAWDRAAVAAGERRRVFCGSLCDWCDAHPVAEATRPRLWR
jgi:protein gp37